MGLYWFSYPPVSLAIAVVNQISRQIITNSTLIWLKGEIMRLMVEGRTNTFRQIIVAIIHEMMSDNWRSVNTESSLKHPLTFCQNTSCFWFWMSTLDQNRQIWTSATRKWFQGYWDGLIFNNKRYFCPSKLLQKLYIYQQSLQYSVVFTPIDLVQDGPLFSVSWNQ